MEIGNEEVFEFRTGVKRRARETNDNSQRIIAEASGKLSDVAKTLLPSERKSEVETLKIQFQVEAIPLHSHFENTYVGRRDELGNNIPPLFTI